MSSVVRLEAPDYHHINSAAEACEIALIGACLMYGPSLHVAMSIAREEHFKGELNRTLWRTMTDMAAEGRPANPVTITAVLGNPMVDGRTLAASLAAMAADTHCIPAHVADFARQVREFWALRKVAACSGEAVQYALAPGARARQLISGVIQELDETRAAVEARATQGRMLSDGIDHVVDRMGRIMQGEVLDVFMTTGLRDLDRKLGGGFKPGELIVIAGRPGMGKTTFAVSIARQMAFAGACGGFFSMEMPADQISARFLTDTLFSGPGTLVANQILTGRLDPQQAERVIEASRSYKALPLSLDDSSSLTVGEIGARARSLRARYEREGKRLQFIIIDYLKFIRSSERYRGQRYLEVGEITAGLKSLAKDLGIAVILLCQLNRETEKTADKRPELGHLRDSGEIEQDADAVLFLYREAYYLTKISDQEQRDDCANKLEVIIAKQRMGETGTIEVFCHPGASAVRDARF